MVLSLPLSPSLSSLKGLPYQALAPAQERRLAADHRNRQRGPLPLPARPLIPESSRAPHQLAQPNFFISRAARTSRLASAPSVC